MSNMNKLLTGLAALAVAAFIACGGGKDTSPVASITTVAPTPTATAVPSDEITATAIPWTAETCNTAEDPRCLAYHRIFLGLSTALYPDISVALSPEATAWLTCAATATSLGFEVMGGLDGALTNTAADELAQQAAEVCGSPPD